MYRKDSIRKASLALVIVLLLSVMMPVLAFAASKIDLIYDGNTGNLSGTIYSDQSSVSIDVYSNGKTVTVGTYSSETVTSGTYVHTVSASTYTGLAPSKITIWESAASTVVQSVYSNVYKFDNIAPGAPKILYAIPVLFEDPNKPAIILGWTHPSDIDVQTFNIYVDGEKRTSTIGTNYTIKDLAVGPHTVGVAAVDDVGNISSISTKAVYQPGSFKSISLGLENKPVGYYLKPGDSIVTFEPDQSAGKVNPGIFVELPFIYDPSTSGFQGSKINKANLALSDLELVDNEGKRHPIDEVESFIDDFTQNAFFVVGSYTALEAGKVYTLKLSATSGGNEIQLPQVKSDKAGAGVSIYSAESEQNVYAVEMKGFSGLHIGNGTESAPTTPSYPPVIGAPPANNTDATVQIVNEASLKSGKDGKVTVEIANGKKSVLLPAHAAEVIGNNKLEIKAEGVTAVIPKEVLKQLQDLVPADVLKDAQIKFTVDKVTGEAAAKLVNSAKGKAKAELKAAGDVYDFSLSVVAKDGKETKLSKFEKPITLKFKVNEKANKDLVGAYYLADDGTIEYVGGKFVDGVLQADIYHFSKYAVLEFDKTFTDVPASHWGFDAVKKLAAKHVVQGVTDTEFAPSKEVTRAEFAALLVRALGLKSTKAPAFKDVAADDWYFEAVAAAYEAKLVTGRSIDEFAPNATITREEIAILVVRAYEYASKKQAVAKVKADFADQQEVSAWAATYVDAAAELKLLNGRGDKLFAPKDSATRAESVQVIINLLAK